MNHPPGHPLFLTKGTHHVAKLLIIIQNLQHGCNTAKKLTANHQWSHLFYIYIYLTSTVASKRYIFTTSAFPTLTKDKEQVLAQCKHHCQNDIREQKPQPVAQRVCTVAICWYVLVSVLYHLGSAGYKSLLGNSVCGTSMDKSMEWYTVWHLQACQCKFEMICESHLVAINLWQWPLYSELRPKACRQCIASFRVQDVFFNSSKLAPNNLHELMLLGR